MDKFDLLVESLGVDEAALKLFPNIPSEHQREVLLRHNLQLWTLLSWHATGDAHAPHKPVVELLRERGAQAWMLLHQSFGEIAHDRQRDWLLACAEIVPEFAWFTVGARVACPLAAEIIEALRRGDVDALPRPEFDPKFWKLLVASSRDEELADVLKAWLASLEGYARLAYIALLHRAAVLDRIVGLVGLLPNVGAPSWPPERPDGDEYSVVNVAHWIALNVPEVHGEAADVWVVEQFLSSARSGIPWLDLFWRIAPRLRSRVAIASLDLEPRFWAPFAGVALAEQIAAGRTDLWQRAMAWLRSVRSVRDERSGSYDRDWVKRQFEVEAWLRTFGSHEVRPMRHVTSSTANSSEISVVQPSKRPRATKSKRNRGKASLPLLSFCVVQRALRVLPVVDDRIHELVAKRRRAGHFCFSCARRRPNESFSGGGHARHECRECRAAARAKRRLLALLVPIAHDDAAGFIDAERFALLLRMEDDALSAAASPERHTDAGPRSRDKGRKGIVGDR